MTISEQLQFSVLTAPVATLDRRTLSQAWYSALYGSGATASSAKNATPQAPQTQQRIVPARKTPANQEPEHTRSLRATGAQTVQRAQGAPPERRAPRSALARKIERAVLRPRSVAHKASFTIDGEQGRVHIVLHTQGTQLKLVAICPPKACVHVAAALSQARYALASRGIDLVAQTRGATAC